MTKPEKQLGAKMRLLIISIFACTLISNCGGQTTQSLSETEWKSFMTNADLLVGRRARFYVVHSSETYDSPIGKINGYPTKFKSSVTFTAVASRDKQAMDNRDNLQGVILNASQDGLDLSQLHDYEARFYVDVTIIGEFHDEAGSVPALSINSIHSD